MLSAVSQTGLVQPQPAAESYRMASGGLDMFGESSRISRPAATDDRSLKVLCRYSCGVLGALQLFCGGVSVVLELCNLLIPAEVYWPLGTGVWVGVVWAATGVVGVWLARWPRHRLVNLLLILSTLSILMALWGVMEGVINYLKALSCCQYNLVIPHNFQVLPLVKSVVSFLSLLTSVWVAVLCYRAGYYDDCCCQGRGVAGAPEPLYGGVGSSSMYTTSDNSSGQFKFELSGFSPTKMLSQSQIYTPGSANTTELTDISFLEMEI